MSDEFCIADTEYGQVRGAKVISEVGKPYWRFLGIPYAKPPVGELRFQKASKASSWNGVLDALREPSPCAGKSSQARGPSSGYIGSDDCLYLNIFTKNLKPSKPSAVFVYIHGGGFISGSSSLSSYSPDYLLMHDIVVVTFNYRIGPLGFLSLKDKNLNVPGNAGMKDQQMVFEFIRENIHNFGGDASNVTIAGHSSGAACVGFHCLSESSRGLFDRAIITGGSPISRVLPDLDLAERLAEKLGFTGSMNEEEILNFLRAVEVLELTEASNQILTKEEQFEYKIFYPFCPSIEPYKTESTFLASNPLNLLKSSWSNEIDLMFGGVAHEGRLAYRFRKFFLKEISLEKEIPTEIKSNVDDVKLEEIIKRWKEFYGKIEGSEQEKIEMMLGDCFTWMPMLRFVRHRQSVNMKGKTFIYKFAVDSPSQNFHRLRFFPDVRGTTHGDELSYIWKSEKTDLPPKDSMEFQAIENFLSIIVNFMVTGDPKICDWHSISEINQKACKITNEGLKIEKLEEFERVFEFWEKIYNEIEIKYF